MTNGNPEAVDKLVLAYLEREEAQVDFEGLLARIEADRRLGSAARPDEGATRSRWALLRGTWWLTMAGMILVAFLVGRSFPPATASASTLLRSVQEAHQQAIDRCYRVLHVPEPAADGRPSAKGGGSESLLWTRGDRFWSDCRIGDSRLKIGRNADGTLWLAPSRQKGIRFSPSDVFPKDVETICQISSLTVPILMDRVLADFDLRTEAPLAQAGNRRSFLWARLKPGRTHGFLSAASLEIDQETDVLVRMVLWLQKDNLPNGTVSYSLLEESHPGDNSYQLESHLDADAIIEDQSFQKKT